MEYYFIKSERWVSTPESRFFAWKTRSHYYLIPTEQVILQQETWNGRWHPFEIYKKLLLQIKQKFFDFQQLYCHEENKTYVSYAVLPDGLNIDTLFSDAIVTGLPWLLSADIRKYSQSRIYTIAYIQGEQLEFAFFRHSLLIQIFCGPASDPIRTWARFTQSVPIASAGILQCISTDLFESLKQHHRETYLLKTENMKHGKLFTMMHEMI